MAFYVVHLGDMVNILGEPECNNRVADFLCPLKAKISMAAFATSVKSFLAKGK